MRYTGLVLALAATLGAAACSALLGVSEVGFAPGDGGETGARETGASEAGIVETGAGEAEAEETGASEGGVGEAGVGEAGPRDAGVDVSVDPPPASGPVCGMASSRCDPGRECCWTVSGASGDTCVLPGNCLSVPGDTFMLSCSDSASCPSTKRYCCLAVQGDAAAGSSCSAGACIGGVQLCSTGVECLTGKPCSIPKPYGLDSYYTACAP